MGTVAAGVAKARADHVTISGFEGGTGASPLTSLTHAGSPWEIGLAETQQTLLLNGLRTRIAVQVDGGLRTGRDVAVAALLGADEFGFATAPLIAAGCIMMRKCHLNTCPVGVATQDPVLRARFTGQPEHVINYFFFVAEELREIMAEMGFRTVNEMIGRVDRIDMRPALDHWKAHGVDLSRILYRGRRPTRQGRCGTPTARTTAWARRSTTPLIAAAEPALEGRASRCAASYQVRNINRTVGAMLSGEVARRYRPRRPAGRDHPAEVHAASPGQSFGAFLARGVSLDLTGDANDYVGKGLSGGRVIVRQPRRPKREPTENIIVGNTVLYGAIAGEAYFEGVAGERFAVRNSGAVDGGRGRGRPRLRIHDRRRGGGARRNRPQLRGRHARRRRLRLRPGRPLQRALQPGHGGAGADRAGDAGPAADEAARPSQRTLSVENSGMGDMLRFDAERLRILIERHLLHTGSAARAEISGQLGPGAGVVREGDAERLPPRSA